MLILYTNCWFMKECGFDLRLFWTMYGLVFGIIGVFNAGLTVRLDARPVRRGLLCFVGIVSWILLWWICWTRLYLRLCLIS